MGSRSEDVSHTGCCEGELLNTVEGGGGGTWHMAQSRGMFRRAALASCVQVTAGGAYPAHFHEVCDHDDAG